MALVMVSNDFTTPEVPVISRKPELLVAVQIEYRGKNR
jgi:hypothetical protein